MSLRSRVSKFVCISSRWTSGRPLAIPEPTPQQVGGKRRVCVRRVGDHLLDLMKYGLASFLDKHGLAGKYILDVAKPELGQGDGLGGEHVVGGAAEGAGWSCFLFVCLVVVGVSVAVVV